jgi:hypothetical protein
MSNDDLDGAIAMAANAIVGEARREAFRWECRDYCGVEYIPPLFRMDGVELPIVPRIALPRIEGAARPQGRR